MASSHNCYPPPMASGGTACSQLCVAFRWVEPRSGWIGPYRTNSRIARSSPSSVKGYIRPSINCRTIWIECV